MSQLLGSILFHCIYGNRQGTADQGLLGQVGGGHKARRADPKAAQEEAGDAAQHASSGDGVPGREGVSWFSFIPVIPNRNNTFSNGRGRNWRQNTFRTFSKVFYLAN